MTILLWFEGSLNSRVGRYSDFWLQIYSPAFSVWMADGAFVSSYSSATVADFHGVPCTDVSETYGPKFFGLNLKELRRRVRRTKHEFKKIRALVRIHRVARRKKYSHRLPAPTGRDKNVAPTV